MSIRSLRWAALTAFGLAVGIGMALVLQDPVEALVGMVLLTPVLTAVVGASLGAFQWVELRHRLEPAGALVLVATAGASLGALTARPAVGAAPAAQ